MNKDNNSQPNYRKLNKIYIKVRKQMEFYFSDSNLVKDKFLSDLISKDPDGFVELEIFKTFNKIKALTNSCEVIKSAISRSNMFEISKDNKKIRRITPVELTKDFDACTLYVEKLPRNADQKWIKDVFGQFGTIKYVNVPRFKVTNRIKGFAFVEFENPEGVKNACEFYKISSEKESSASEDESKVTKNAKKHKQHEENLNDKKNKKSRTKSVSESSDKVSDFSSAKNDQHENTLDKDIDSDKDLSPLKERRKRKRDESFSETTTKKSKESDNEDLNTSTTFSNADQSELKEESDSIQSRDQEDSKNENMPEVSNNHENGTEVEEKKSKRKRKKSKKNHSNAEKPALRVMPKSEWKTYRNKYLELQRKTMSLLKKHVFLGTQEVKELESHTKSMDVTEPKKTFQFTPGVIIKVKLSEPVKTPSEVKNQVKASVVVAYIDAPIESSEIFIRCHNSDEAETIIKEEKLSHLGKIELIQGEEEKSYWEKIETDRKNKYENPVPHKKRGRDKILAKAAKLEEMKNKHVYFDE